MDSLNYPILNLEILRERIHKVYTLGDGSHIETLAEYDGDLIQPGDSPVLCVPESDFPKSEIFD